MEEITSRFFPTFTIKASLTMHVGWQVSMSDEPNPLFRFAPPGVTETKTPEGQTWVVPRAEVDLDRLLQALFCVDDADSALQFFRKFGPMDLDKRHGRHAGEIRLSEVRSLRDRRRASLLGSTLAELHAEQRYRDKLIEAEELRSSTPLRRQERQHAQKAKQATVAMVATLFDLEVAISPEVRLTRNGESVIGVIESQDIRSATSAAVFLDRLNGFGWGTCKECLQPFKRLSRHKRKYCSPQCLSYATTSKQMNPGKSVRARRSEKRRSPQSSISRVRSSTVTTVRA